MSISYVFNVFPTNIEGGKSDLHPHLGNRSHKGYRKRLEFIYLENC
ncbi:MAG: hypothetical protein QXO59_05290 [Candidatus Jordarchaeales archaeon]